MASCMNYITGSDLELKMIMIVLQRVVGVIEI